MKDSINNHEERVPRSGVMILNTMIDNMTFAQVLRRIEVMVAERKPRQIITANVDHLMLKRRLPDLDAICRKSPLVVPDGVPLLWASRILKPLLHERINGTDLMEQTCRLATDREFSVFLLGGHPQAADQSARRLKERFPRIKVAGTYFPYFGFENDRLENEKIIALLLEKKPDILFTALGILKGVRWLDAHLGPSGVPLGIEVGASFGYVSGQLKRAPRWMQRHGLEWSWRLLCEPRRLWRRYLVRDLPFFFFVLKQKCVLLLEPILKGSK